MATLGLSRPDAHNCIRLCQILGMTPPKSDLPLLAWPAVVWSFSFLHFIILINPEIVPNGGIRGI